MELILIFSGAFIVGLSGALMPGPLMTITISHSVKRGFIAGPLVILGHMILEISLLIAIVLGFKNVISAPLAMKVVFIAGGAILIALGIDLMINHRKSTVPTGTTEKSALKKVFSHPIISGIVVSLSNPYWTIWWVTIGLGYVIKALKYGFLGITLFFSGHILSDLIWYSFISYTFSRGKKFFHDRTYHSIIFICGIFLIFFGLWFLYSGL
ncbi:MAG: LysE family translocator [Spirochaetes bacterium]|nr:LysE family translocator [Spirochaetota bacterium]